MNEWWLYLKYWGHFMDKYLIPGLPKFGLGPTPLFLGLYMECGFRDDNNLKFRDFTESMMFYHDHYYEHAQHRLEDMYNNYHAIGKDVSDSIKKGQKPRNIGSLLATQVYWNFEDYLSSMRSLLDIYMVICRGASAAPGSLPWSFSVLNKANAELVKLDRLYIILYEAYCNWAYDMIQYRDFYIHYGPFEDVHASRITLSQDGFKICHRLPDNPKLPRHQFKYTKNVDALEYSITVYNKLTELQSALVSEICSLNKIGKYPHMNFDYKRSRPMGK